MLLAAFPTHPIPIVEVTARPPDQNAVPAIPQSEFAQLFQIFDALLTGAASDHFVVDFQLQRVTRVRADR